MSSIYSAEESEVPGKWIFRHDNVWINKETNEIISIKEGTMREIENREDCYRVNKHIDGGVETILDNISKERAHEVVEKYIKTGEVPDESWLSTGDKP